MEESIKPLSEIPAINRFLSYCRIRAVPSKTVVIHAGDLFSNGFYPNIDASSLGWIGGMIAAADRLLKLAGPKTRIIPGHGALATPADLAAFRKMLVMVHDRLAPMLDAGKTLQALSHAARIVEFFEDSQALAEQCRGALIVALLAQQARQTAEAVGYAGARSA